MRSCSNCLSKIFDLFFWKNLFKIELFCRSIKALIIRIKNCLYGSEVFERFPSSSFQRIPFPVDFEQLMAI
jgi:hypothetical protein